MSRLRTLSGKEIVKFLQKQGFELEYGKGSHCKLVRLVGEEKQGIAIPLHKEIAKGTLKAIYNQASVYIPKDQLRKFFYTK
ncbi:MAG: hypothetical protein CO183_02730 [Candidatus Zambryskibacteria bacterium CG_4_9_14_3_um_filter_42_9]|nr:MAG: hypothetical protein CO183_02730 [Candidatus Zambryskibacteria bacterium CG_4_9_14_3_um_filter_42_9]